MVDRKDIIDSIANEIETHRQRLDKLRVQAKLAENETRDALQPEIERLEGELSNAKDRLEKFRELSEDVMAEAKKGVDGALSELKKGFDNAFQRLQQK
ncbi:MAG: hypothetical protein ACLFPX_01525 [Candidatus Omnitrophota bacterium]